MVLDGITIIELAQTKAPALSTLILAEAGATVIKIDQPNKQSEKVTAGAALQNRGKKRVFIDLENTDWRAKIRRMLAFADVFVHDLCPSQAKAVNLDADTLRADFPSLISSAVTPYPGNHPDKNRKGTDSLVMARLGLLDEQKGHRDGPIYISFPLGTMGAAYLSAIGILARLIQRQKTGMGGAADTSLMQGMLAPMAMHWAKAEKPDPSFSYGIPKDNSPSLFECADGQWVHLMASPDKCPTMQALFEKLGSDAVAEANGLFPANRLFPNFGANTKMFKTRDRSFWLEELWANDVPAQGVALMGEIFFDQQAHANNYVVTVDDPNLGKILQPGPPFSITPPAKAGHAASLPGADTDDILAWLDHEQHSAKLASPGKNFATDIPPLTGLKLVDFGNFLAGPFAAMLLADLGADVIKVESRNGDPMRVVARAFAGCQRNKRSIAVDLRSHQAGPIRDALIKWADVVHHNLRENAAVKLGLDYKCASTVNPDIVHCHVTAYGKKGERSTWPGYDQLFQAASGWEKEAGGKGNPPIWHRFGMMDHQCAMASTVATLLGVYSRGETGRGQAVSASILGASLMTLNDISVRADGRVQGKVQLNSEQTGVSHGDRIYQCADGGWVAVDMSEAQIERLKVALSSKEIPTLELYFLSLSQALAEKVVEEFGGTTERVKLDQCADFLSSKSNLASNACIELMHRDYGKIVQVGAFWNTDSLAQKFERAPPTLGEHSAEILKGFDFLDADIGKLRADKIVR